MALDGRLSRPSTRKVLFRDLYERLMKDGGLSEKTCDTYRWLVGPKEIQAMCGHSSIVTTLDTYGPSSTLARRTLLTGTMRLSVGFGSRRRGRPREVWGMGRGHTVRPPDHPSGW